MTKYKFKTFHWQETYKQNLNGSDWLEENICKQTKKKDFIYKKH